MKTKPTAQAHHARAHPTKQAAPAETTRADDIRCQFCGKHSPRAAWKKDACPRCSRVYDPILAQEGDD